MTHFEEGGPARVAQQDPIIIEPAAVGPAAAVPHEKVDRTPAALQHLEGLLVGYLHMDGRKLVSLLGAIEDKGSVALFGEVEEIGMTQYRMYRVVSYDTQDGRFTHASRTDRAQAEHLYDQRREELS